MECSLGPHPEVLDQPLANPQQPLLILTRRRQYEEQVGVGEGKGMGGERWEASKYRSVQNDCRSGISHKFMK